MPEKDKAEETSQKEGQKESILKMSEISIWLDAYDDIFSDFDPRQYSQRSLSDDFITEAKKASRDKDPNKLELSLLLPANNRDAKNEAIIKKRLHEHFAKHAKLLSKEIKDTRIKSLAAAFLGILMMLGATYINSFESDTFATRFLFVLLEPAGWFVTWFALDKFFYTAEVKKKEYNFYEKMSKSEIIFSSY